MADSQRANILAQQSGYIRADYLVDWRGFGVYEPVVADDGEIYSIGKTLILQNDEECRWMTPDEADSYSEEVEENMIEDY